MNRSVDPAAGPSYDVVVPTVGRPTLRALVESLAGADEPRPERIVVVDDRRDRRQPLLSGLLRPGIEIVPGPGRGPGAARNAGWRRGCAEWAVFVDDDVVLPAGWHRRLGADLAGAGPGVGGSQGRIVVPPPAGRPPTDLERNVAGLETARWATADMAYRRAALAAVGGFDERFPRAYREDADLGARVVAHGWEIVRGERHVEHPVRPGTAWDSVRAQAGNADDVMMRVIHGRRWRQLTGVPAGRRGRHLAVTLAGAAGLAGLATGRRVLAAAGAGAWLAGTAELAWARIAPGPRNPREVAAMVVTSAVIPAAASGHWLLGWVLLPRRLRGGRLRPAGPVRAAAVLLDRDGTLVVDVPYNGDPARVEPMPGARRALDRLRSAGIATGVVSNQSGIGRGLITDDQVEAVNNRVEDLLGPFGVWAVCPHDPLDGCWCRKPGPGLVVEAAAALGVDPDQVVVIGDIGADIEAARAAGARGVLVPTAATRPEEVESASEVAPDLESAVDLVLSGGPL